MIVLKIAQAVVSRRNVIVLECDCTGMWLYSVFSSTYSRYKTWDVCTPLTKRWQSRTTAYYAAILYKMSWI